MLPAAPWGRTCLAASWSSSSDYHNTMLPIPHHIEHS
jgi:hypothetical protein